MKPEDVVIVAAGRTAIGTFNGALANVPATVLGTTVVKTLLERSKINAQDIDEVIMGQVYTADAGANPARQTSIGSGIPVEIPAVTVNKLCGTGLKAIILGVQTIRCGDAEIVIAGGQESMDLAPHALGKSRQGKRMGDWPLVDTMLRDGLVDVFNNYHMGVTAENVAEQFGISREEQDAFATESQRRTKEAMTAGKFKDEIIPVTIPQRKGEPIIFDTDEHPKPKTTVEVLSKLPTAFKKEGGTVTAGNSSGVNDGAAAVILTTAKKAEELGLTPIAHIVAYASAGVDPKIMGTGPVPASKKCLEKANWSVEDLDLIEANEAFAAQAIYVNNIMGWDTDKVNVNGGAIALGHPVGATGARLLVTLLYEMKKRDAHKGLVTMCIGGGMGITMAVER